MMLLSSAQRYVLNRRGKKHSNGFIDIRMRDIIAVRYRLFMAVVQTRE